MVRGHVDIITNFYCKSSAASRPEAREQHDPYDIIATTLLSRIDEKLRSFTTTHECIPADVGRDILTHRWPSVCKVRNIPEGDNSLRIGEGNWKGGGNKEQCTVVTVRDEVKIKCESVICLLALELAAIECRGR